MNEQTFTVQRRTRKIWFTVTNGEYIGVDRYEITKRLPHLWYGGGSNYVFCNTLVRKSEAARLVAAAVLDITGYAPKWPGSVLETLRGCGMLSRKQPRLTELFAEGFLARERGTAHGEKMLKAYRLFMKNKRLTWRDFIGDLKDIGYSVDFYSDEEMLFANPPSK